MPDSFIDTLWAVIKRMQVCKGHIVRVRGPGGEWREDPGVCGEGHMHARQHSFHLCASACCVGRMCRRMGPFLHKLRGPVHEIRMRFQDRALDFLMLLAPSDLSLTGTVIAA